MGTFGERLQREREMRGISLDEISGATKISTRSLRALELQEFDKLPGGVFNKGFVRAYSRYLGIDEEQAVADYISAATEAAAGTREAQKSEPLSAGLDRVGLWEEPKDWRRLGAAFLLVTALGAIGAGAWFVYARRPSPLQWAKGVLSQHPFPLGQSSVAPPPAPVPPPPPAIAQFPLADASPASPLPSIPPPALTNIAAIASDPAPASAPAGADAQPAEFVVQLRGRHQSRVSVLADGKEVMNGTLVRADEKPFRARQLVVITATDPAAVQYSFNGRPFRLLGRSHEEQSLTFTPGGMQR